MRSEDFFEGTSTLNLVALFRNRLKSASLFQAIRGIS